MAEVANFPHRVLIADVRDNGTYIRVTWHADRSTFVLSHWDNNGCIAATRVSVDDVPQLIGLLTNGLADALASERAVPPPAQGVRRLAWAALMRSFRRRRRHQPVADVVPLRISDVPQMTFDELPWMKSESC
ncbi:MAG: hypothetical protein ABJD24_00980 [Acidimicrobiales bacterium]